MAGVGISEAVVRGVVITQKNPMLQRRRAIVTRRVHLGVRRCPIRAQLLRRS
jgi:hypothetical protein